MKTWTKQVLFTICIIAGYLWSDAAVPENVDQNSDMDLLPEFCVATFLTVGSAADADIWLGRYQLDRAVIAFMQHNLRQMLDANEIRGEDIIAAADECRRAERSERQ